MTDQQPPARAGQVGPVVQGKRSAAPGMDPDRALSELESVILGGRPASGEGPDLEAQAAHDALSRLVHAARAYVRGQSPGRLEALAAALQEPVGPAVVVDVETVVQSYLTERDLVTIPRKMARSIGMNV